MQLSKEMGLYLEGEDLFSSLFIGETFAYFQRAGKYPCCKERLKILVSGLEMTKAPSLRRGGLIKSGPHTLVTFKLLQTSFTSCLVMSMCAYSSC